MTTKRNIGIGAAILGALGVVAFTTLRQSIAQTRGRLQLAQLQQPVEVMRDTWGVPHIYAQNTHDLFLAQGFVHAQDRLWQMETQRRLGHGRLAELVGARAIDTDRFMRILGLGRSAVRDAQTVSGQTHDALTAYVEGVNAFIAQHQRKLPPEFLLLRHTPTPWSIADVLVWGKVMALSLSGNWQQEILRAQLIAKIGATRASAYEPRQRDDMPVIVPPGLQYTATIGQSAVDMAENARPWLNDNENNGSNNWVVAGSRSTSGLPLLANDPHLGITIPSVWYEIHLNAPDYHVAGASFAGVPGVVIGHNERIAWGVTNSMTDVQDLYIERFDPNDASGRRYEYQGEWHQAELIYETITVKGGAPVIEPVRITRHGPIITPLIDAAGNREPQPLALQWTALHTSTLFDAILDLNRATDWESFRAALHKWDVPPQNFVYADVAGHIGYQLAGAIPVRSNSDGRVPVPGWSGEYEWQGFVPFAQLPASYDPATGYIATANNRIVPNDRTPAIRGEWSNGWRAARIIQRLTQHERHDAASFAGIHADHFHMGSHDIIALAGRLPDGDAVANQARALLSAWDGMVATHSIASTIALQFVEELQHVVFASHLDMMQRILGIGALISRPGREYMNRATPDMLRAALLNDNDWFGDTRAWDDVLPTAWQQTVRTLKKRLGNNPNQWRYGAWHTITLAHPLGAIPLIGKLFTRGPYELGGNRDTVNMGDINTLGNKSIVYTCPSLRIICDTSDWDLCKSIHPVGQSGHPLSTHFSDFIKAWLNVEYHPMPWQRRRVEEVCHETLTLTP
ncbi:MAG: penicillin acylase family protein [Roseiflexaceae bacterium]